MSEQAKKYEYQVKINYKSGNSESLWFESFEVRTRGTELIGLTTTTVKGVQKLMFTGLDNIESIIQTDVREAETTEVAA